MTEIEKKTNKMSSLLIKALSLITEQFNKEMSEIIGFEMEEKGLKVKDGWVPNLNDQCFTKENKPVSVPGVKK